MTVQTYKLLLGAAVMMATLMSCGEEDTAGENSIGYVDNMKLFDGFEMTKEMESELQVIRDSAQQELDSLGKKLEVRAKSIELVGDVSESEKTEFARMQEYFLMRKRTRELEVEQRINELRSTVWDSLNVYIKEFGAEGKYDMIMGANGSGNLMYADSTLDLTNEILDFCNKKYGK